MFKNFLKIFVSFIAFCSFGGYVSAYDLKTIDIPEIGDIKLEPATLDLEISAGETVESEIIITNRLGRKATFKISFEDIKGTDGRGDSDIILLGEKSGPNSIKDFLTAEHESFVLEHGQELRMPIYLSVPGSLNPGGLYGDVIVSVESELPGGGISNTHIQSRLGAHLLVRAGDNFEEEGSLKKFDTVNSKKIFIGSLPEFVVTFENNGNVHLNTYGLITIKSMINKVSDIVEIKPWFILPESIRSRTFEMNGKPVFGRYEATLELNRGYEDIIDTETVVFWYMNYPVLILFVVIILLILILIIRKRRAALVIATFIFVIGFVGASDLDAYRASSTNYRIERDSINTGGVLSTSTNYSLEDTVGEVATGRQTSTTYILNAGYQQTDQDTYITITSPSDVTLLPAINANDGGIADGSATWTVETNSSGGYILYINASTDPALQSSGSSFADYTPIGIPDYSWNVAASDKEFGFTPEGSDIIGRYQDNGSVCNAGALDTASACWDALTTSISTIANSASANNPAGTDTTVRFRAEAGSSSNVSTGDYVATITLTAVTQ